MNINDDLNFSINNKYKIIEKIGSGCFGNIYKGKNIRTNKNVAIKIERKNSSYNLLKNEVIIYKCLKGCRGIGELKWFGSDNYNNYMVIDLLGISLEKLISKYNNFSLKLIIKIGLEILNIIMDIHNNGYIHRDIKPDNFLLNDFNNLEQLNNDSVNNYKLYIIDFGFSIRYIDNNNNHYKQKKINGLIGSKNYASINSHYLNTLSRRDDLESLFYILIYLYYGKLDWENEINENIIIKKKENIIYNNNIPDVLLNFINYIRKLKFEEKPNYFYIMNFFRYFYTIY